MKEWSYLLPHLLLLKAISLFLVVYVQHFRKHALKCVHFIISIYPFLYLTVFLFVHLHILSCFGQVLCWGVRDMKRFRLLQVTSPLVELECGGNLVKTKPIQNAKKNPNFPDPVITMDVVSTIICFNY